MYLQSPFWTEWHRSRGDAKIQLSPWQNITGLDAGRIRQLTFVTPLKSVSLSAILLQQCRANYMLVLLGACQPLLYPEAGSNIAHAAAACMHSALP